jgi:hypothetical protein
MCVLLHNRRRTNGELLWIDLGFEHLCHTSTADWFVLECMKQTMPVDTERVYQALFGVAPGAGARTPL